MRKVKPTFSRHAKKQIEKRKLPWGLIKKVIKEGVVVRIHFDGKKKIVLGDAIVILAKDATVVTAFYDTPQPEAKASKQHIKGKKPQGKFDESEYY